MTHTPTPVARLTPRIPTGGRPILPGGRNPLPLLLGLYVAPAIGFVIAMLDTRSGFRLLMASLGFALLVLVLGLTARVRALRAGAIHVAAAGELRFVPPRSQRAAMVAVPLAFLVPAVALVLIAVLDLPTQPSSSRLAAALPYVLWVFSLVTLARLCLSLRVALGLRVGPDGLRGVRGSKRVELAWEDLASAAPVGAHGPKLLLSTRAGASIVVDANHTGSDPAIIAAVIEHYRARPASRAELADGIGAIRAVEAAAA